jgi:hypothetical protein
MLSDADQAESFFSGLPTTRIVKLVSGSEKNFDGVWSRGAVFTFSTMPPGPPGMPYLHI